MLDYLRSKLPDGCSVHVQSSMDPLPPNVDQRENVVIIPVFFVHNRLDMIHSTIAQLNIRKPKNLVPLLIASSPEALWAVKSFEPSRSSLGGNPCFVTGCISFKDLENTTVIDDRYFKKDPNPFMQLREALTLYQESLLSAVEAPVEVTTVIEAKTLPLLELYICRASFRVEHEEQHIEFIQSQIPSSYTVKIVDTIPDLEWKTDVVVLKIYYPVKPRLDFVFTNIKVLHDEQHTKNFIPVLIYRDSRDNESTARHSASVLGSAEGTGRCCVLGGTYTALGLSLPNEDLRKTTWQKLAAERNSKFDLRQKLVAYQEKWAKENPPES